MLKYLLVFVFSFVSLFGTAQDHRIIISDWVNEPSIQNLEKPLIFVDFWATWCIPCIHAMPQTELLEKEFGEDVLFLLISDETTDKVEHFMEKFHKEFYSAVDNSRTTHEMFNVRTIPYSVLLDNTGKLIWDGQPLDLKRQTLQNFVNKYKNKAGLKSRINLVKQVIEEDHWSTFISNGVSMKYLKKKSVSNSFSVEDGEYYFSGNTKQIVSMIYNISLSSITCDTKIEEKYIIKCASNDYQEFTQILESFLQEECKVVIERQEEISESYILKDQGDENFLTADSYNFEKGNNSYLADDMDVTIDNATIEEMVNILSDFSEYRYIYHGDNPKRYDWKIHYKFNNLTLEQLESELNFTITKESVTLENVHIRALD